MMLWRAVLISFVFAACAQAQNAPPLTLERAIALPDVAGRIDHLAIDPEHRRLAVAELENHSVDIVDIARGTVLHRIANLGEPQGLAFDQTGRRLLVSERSGGALRVFNAQSFEPEATIQLGADADNVRIDQRNGHAVVGYGDGALAIVDVSARSVLARIALPAHPESFQIDARTGRAFVNLPDRRTIGVVDLDAGALVATWRLPLLLWNYPLAFDPAGSRLAVAFRGPARLVLFSLDGAVTSSQATCADSDDLFFDQRRRRLYVACGGGAVDTFDVSAAPRALERTQTSRGARTALFVPELDRLFVAARADRRAQASILVLRPNP